MSSEQQRVGAGVDARSGSDPAALLTAAASGEKAALGRLLSVIEREGEGARALGRLLVAVPEPDHHVVGITGAPGSGKSTLTDGLVARARAEGGRVAVLAVDPSSPFSGGALLGDRVRMQGHALDDGVFIRSMASRGQLGGLAVAAPGAIRLLVATGHPLVLVETVGVGQVEVEIAGAADTTVVVVNPGWGDAVQASKAGLMEVADLFVVNKSERPGAEETKRDLEAMLDLAAPGRWRPPVLLSSAASGEGVGAVWMAIGEHYRHLSTSDELERRRARRLLGELDRAVEAELRLRLSALDGGDGLERVKRDVLARRIDPRTAAENLIRPLIAGRG